MHVSVVHLRGLGRLELHLCREPLVHQPDERVSEALHVIRREPEAEAEG